MVWWNRRDLSDVVLPGPRLTLRPWRGDDAEVVHEAMRDRTVHEFVTLPDPYTRHDARFWVQEHGPSARAAGAALTCAVEDNATGRVVGSADLQLPNAPSGPTGAEIGYLVYRHGRGNGYAAEAADLLARWAFDYGAPRVVIVAAVRNLASVRTASRAGFTYEGVARGGVDTPGGAVDAAVFARCSDDDGAPIAATFAPLPAGGLADGLITLRVPTPEDADGIAATANDPETLRWAFSGESMSLISARERAERAALHWLVGTVAQLSIVDGATGRYAGDVSVRLSGPPGVGLVGYSIHPAFRGRGYTARALRLLSQWAITSVDGRQRFGRLELGAKVGNVASQRAARSGGFSDDGIHRARLRNADGSFSDEARFALIAPLHN